MYKHLQKTVFVSANSVKCEKLPKYTDTHINSKITIQNSLMVCCRVERTASDFCTFFFCVCVCVCISSLTTVHQHYDQSHQASLSYDSYGGVTHSSGGGAEADRPPSGTPSTSVHSSPGHHQGNEILISVY